MSEKPELILIGGGGHCKSCIDVIERENKFTIAGIIDMPENIGKEILGYKIIGTDGDLKKMSGQFKYFFITIGQILSPKLRIKVFSKLSEFESKLPTIVSPRAYVSKHSNIGSGSIIMHDVCVNASVTIGSNCIINTGSLIEHDTKIGDFCHISTKSVINGDCEIRDNSFIGSNSVVGNAVIIGENSILSAGTAILKDVDPNSLIKKKC